MQNELEKVRGIGGLEHYEELISKEILLLCESGECAPARIGFGAGHESKTIAVFLKKHYPNLYNALASSMSRAIGRAWDSLTIKAVNVGGRLVGVGWCKVCLE